MHCTPRRMECHTSLQINSVSIQYKKKEKIAANTRLCDSCCTKHRNKTTFAASTDCGLIFAQMERNFFDNLAFNTERRRLHVKFVARYRTKQRVSCDCYIKHDFLGIITFENKYLSNTIVSQYINQSLMANKYINHSLRFPCSLYIIEFFKINIFI
jgi:hypothetical protein